MTKPERDEQERCENTPIVTLDQYRGNRIIHRFFPVHYARVMLARDVATKYPRVSLNG